MSLLPFIGNRHAAPGTAGSQCGMIFQWKALCYDYRVGIFGDIVGCLFFITFVHADFQTWKVIRAISAMSSPFALAFFLAEIRFFFVEFRLRVTVAVVGTAISFCLYSSRENRALLVLIV